MLGSQRRKRVRTQHSDPCLEEAKQFGRNSVAGVSKKQKSAGTTQWPVSRIWVVENLLGLIKIVLEVKGPIGSEKDH